MNKYFSARKLALEAELKELRTETRLVQIVYANKMCDIARKSASIAKKFVDLNKEQHQYSMNGEPTDSQEASVDRPAD